MNKLNKVLEIVNSDILMELVQEVNNWDDSLSHFDYISMDEFDEYLGYLSPTDLANKIHYGDFNPNDDYFNFNGYANLVSWSQWEYEAELTTYKYEIVDRFIELYEEGHAETTYQEILDILDDNIEEE